MPIEDLVTIIATELSCSDSAFSMEAMSDRVLDRFDFFSGWIIFVLSSKIVKYTPIFLHGLSCCFEVILTPNGFIFKNHFDLNKNNQEWKKDIHLDNNLPKIKKLSSMTFDSSFEIWSISTSLNLVSSSSWNRFLSANDSLILAKGLGVETFSITCTLWEVEMFSLSSACDSRLLQEFFFVKHLLVCRFGGSHFGTEPI